MVEGAAAEGRQLDGRDEAVAQADGVHLPTAGGAAEPAVPRSRLDRLYRLPPRNPPRQPAGKERDTGPPEPPQQRQALARHLWACQQAQAREPALARSHDIEDGDHFDSGLRKLRRDPQDQRPGAGDQHPPARNHAVSLEKRLGSAGRHDAGKRPPGYGGRPLIGAAGENDGGGGDHFGPVGACQVHAIPLVDGPDRGAQPRGHPGNGAAVTQGR